VTPLHSAVIPALMRDEGFRAKPYRCTAGRLTIGYGTNLDEGLTDDEAMFLLESRVHAAVLDCLRTWPWFTQLDQVRQGVLVQLRYQLGLAGLLGFRRMLAAFGAKDFESAAKELLDSKLARQDSPARAHRLAHQLRTGKAW
jgi:lysozyme